MFTRTTNGYDGMQYFDTEEDMKQAWRNHELNRYEGQFLPEKVSFGQKLDKYETPTEWAVYKLVVYADTYVYYMEESALKKWNFGFEGSER